jgi:hypothetical protein
MKRYAFFLIFSLFLASNAVVLAQPPSPRPLPTDLLFLGRSPIIVDDVRRGEMYSVFLVDANTLIPHKVLETDEGRIDSAFWSPDGQYIGLIYMAGGPQTLCIHRLDGQEMRCWDLSELTSRVDFPFWEGDQIVAVIRGAQLVTLDTLNGDISLGPELPVDFGKELLAHAQWSPTGTLLAYQVIQKSSDLSATSWEYELHVYNRERGSEQLITTTSAYECFAWSPDGQRLVVFQPDDTFAFFGIDGVKTAEIRPQFDGRGVSGCRMAWSHDGTSMAFDSLYREEPVTNGFFVTNINTQATYLLIDNFYFSLSIAWSPDDTYIVTGLEGLWGAMLVVSMDGLEKQYEGEFYFSPAWRPQ